MALLPTIKRISRDEVKDAPDWITKLLLPINSYFDAIYNALAGKLTFGENILSKKMDLTFQTASDYSSGTFTQITFPRGIGKKVEGLILLQITKDASYYTPITNGVYVDWTESNNNVIIGYVTGLEDLTSYKMRVMVI